MQKHKRHGFTLVELLIAIAIIVTLASIGIVSYRALVFSASETKMAQELDDLKKALQLYYQKYNKMPDGSKDSITLCLVDSTECGTGGMRSQRIEGSIAEELRKVGYMNTPKSFIGGAEFGHKDHFYNFSQQTCCHLPPGSGHWYIGSKTNAPFVRYTSDGAFTFLYFLDPGKDHSEKRCAQGYVIHLRPRLDPEPSKSPIGRLPPACSSRPERIMP